jgi:ribosomal protein S18 acetylase RimI-like enzyme
MSRHDVIVRPVTAAESGESWLVNQAARLLQELVRGGAALGWSDPPPNAEVAKLLSDVATASGRGDACLLAAWLGRELAGMGYWCRYARPTHWPHADIEKVAVAPGYQGRGVGRALMTGLITAATEAGVEVLTLDFRGDNERAVALYRSLGFAEYGRLPRFVAVGSSRYDKVCYFRDLR